MSTILNFTEVLILEAGRKRLQRLKSGKKFFLNETSSVEWIKTGYDSVLEACMVKVARLTSARSHPMLGSKFVYI